MHGYLGDGDAEGLLKVPVHDGLLENGRPRDVAPLPDVDERDRLRDVVQGLQPRDAHDVADLGHHPWLHVLGLPNPSRKSKMVSVTQEPRHKSKGFWSLACHPQQKEQDGECNPRTKALPAASRPWPATPSRKRNMVGVSQEPRHTSRDFSSLACHPKRTGRGTRERAEGSTCCSCLKHHISAHNRFLQ